MASDDDHHLARDLAVVAGHRLIELRAPGGAPDERRKAGDQLAHEFLATELARLRPDDVVLSEEGADDPARLSADRGGIVDPLGGTREVGGAGRTDWAAAGPAGGVARPAEAGVRSRGARPPGPGAPPDQPLRIVVSRSRPAPFLPRM